MNAVQTVRAARRKWYKSNAVTSLDDLIVVAPPGMGKTTTLQ
jgi:hypothetical protein